jgi:hypothetical protein
MAAHSAKLSCSPGTTKTCKEGSAVAENPMASVFIDPTLRCDFHGFMLTITTQADGGGRENRMLLLMGVSFTDPPQTQ